MKWGLAVLFRKGVIYMTWAERVGDLATNIALVFINLVRVVTLLARILAGKLDSFVTGLGERSEQGLARVDTSGRAWVRLPTNVLWGVAAVVLRLLSIVTVFLRQITTTLDDFFRVLAEGESEAAGL